MKQGILLIVAGFLAGCATPQQRSEAALKAGADLLDQAAAEAEANMSPEEKSAFDAQVQSNAIAEMQAAAAVCGTRLQFTDEPRFEDKNVFIVPSATPNQLACVRKSYGFVKAYPK